MSKTRFVATAQIGATAIDILQQIAPVEISPATDEQTLLGLLDGTIGLICRGEGRATRHIIDSAPNLRVIGRPGAGYDTVDVEAATARGIPLIVAPVGGFAVAEGALALLLALVKQLPLCDQWVRRGEWQQRYTTETGDLAERTLGVVGLGRIGIHLAKLARPFGMTVLGYDPYADAQIVRDVGVEVVELAELLGRSDYVSVHVPMNEQTRGMMNRERIASMKKGAIFINTSRGSVVESLDVLVDALDSGALGAVGLDVFPTEPPDLSHRIFKDPRCLFAPHVVGGSKLAMERIYRSMANDMVAVLQGRRPTYCVNPGALA